MRLGAPLFEGFADPSSSVEALRSQGYSAAYCPVDSDQDGDALQAYAEAAQAADVVIAEVLVWSNDGNPLSSDEGRRRQGIATCQEQLALADKIGAQCCPIIAGSRGQGWADPHPENLTDETFDLIVQTFRGIIDAVQPTRTFCTLETMPWVYPDSADSYLRLIEAIDRKQFGVHLDPVNLVCSPQRFYNNGALIRECFAKLGPYVKSCHAKDITMSWQLTVHLDEVRPGLGYLDYPTYLQELDKLGPDVPLMLEHLPTAEEYALAATYIRSVADSLGLSVK